jgi:GH18 family chitinase
MIYSHAKPTAGGDCKLAHPDADAPNLQALKILKARNSRLFVLLSVGAWSGSTYYSLRMSLLNIPRESAFLDPACNGENVRSRWADKNDDQQGGSGIDSRKGEVRSSKHLGGIMFWDLGQDDENARLLDAIHKDFDGH